MNTTSFALAQKLVDGISIPANVIASEWKKKSCFEPILRILNLEDRMRWASLSVWLATCFAVGGLGARWTTPEILGWYAQLRRPAIAPPNWVFGPVWTLLYALMAIAAWRIWLAPPSGIRALALVLFLLQLALNLAWSWIFFNRHAIGAALIDVAALWAAIGATTIAAGQAAPMAAWLLAPYWAWVTFASILNVTFWRLN